MTKTIKPIPRALRKNTWKKFAYFYLYSCGKSSILTTCQWIIPVIILKRPFDLHWSFIVIRLNTRCPSSPRFGLNNKILVGMEWCAWVMSTSSLHTGYLDFLLMLFTFSKPSLEQKTPRALTSTFCFCHCLQCLPYLDKVVSTFFKVADQYRTVISRLEAHYIIEDYPIVRGSSQLLQPLYGMKIRQFSRELWPFFGINVT